MRPLTLAERAVGRPTVSLGGLHCGDRPAVEGSADVDLEQDVDEILRSGFPGMRRLSGRALRAQLDGYLERVPEHDFADTGHRLRNPAALRRWMQAYAAATATTSDAYRRHDGIAVVPAALLGP